MDGWMARWLTLWSRSLTVSQLRDKVGLKGGKNVPNGQSSRPMSSARSKRSNKRPKIASSK